VECKLALGILELEALELLLQAQSQETVLPFQLPLLVVT